MLEQGFICLIKGWLPTGGVFFAGGRERLRDESSLVQVSRPLGVIPVTFAPGCGRLATNPVLTASRECTMTRGHGRIPAHDASGRAGTSPLQCLSVERRRVAGHIPTR